MRLNVFLFCLIALSYASRAQSSSSFNKALASQLDSILVEDQKYRLLINETEKKNGFNSEEMRNLWKMISKKDSVNTHIVTKILDEHGWLGEEEVGQNGNSALFLVIQHADPKTRQKYLPMMKEAVKKGKASTSSLALMEDRVALEQGEKQIYGSQIHKDDNGKCFVAPIEDEVNVNKRRATVGLEPLEEYLRRWGIEYKLPNK